MNRPGLDPPRRGLSSAEYHRLHASGALGDGRRTELLAGEVHEAAAIGGPHARCVRLLAHRLEARCAGRAIVSAQNPIALDDRSEPEPDLALLAPREDFYPEHPRPADVLLVIEVSDTSARLDREVKLPLYAAARIPEVWIVDLPAGRLDTWREPRGGRYRRHARLGPGDLVTPERFPEAGLAVADILGVPTGPDERS